MRCDCGGVRVRAMGRLRSGDTVARRQLDVAHRAGRCARDQPVVANAAPADSLPKQSPTAHPSSLTTSMPSPFRVVRATTGYQCGVAKHLSHVSNTRWPDIASSGTDLRTSWGREGPRERNEGAEMKVTEIFTLGHGHDDDDRRHRGWEDHDWEHHDWRRHWRRHWDRRNDCWSWN